MKSLLDTPNYLRPMTRTQLAHAYGIDRKTLYNWTKEIENPPVCGRLLSPKCLQSIYDKYGIPPAFIKKSDFVF